MAGASLAVDIGGTFTDVVLRVGERIYADKTLTTHEDLLAGFFSGVRLVLGQAELAPSDITGAIVHATTLVTNTVIERKGARTAMTFTRGFADILRIRDERRYDMYDPQIEFPEPLVPPERVRTVRERVLADGSVECEAVAEDIDALCAWLEAEQIQSLGICLLHSYRNGVNERRIADVVRRRLPGLCLSLSSEIAPQIREYPRASTTAMNAYTMPVTRPYLERLGERLAAERFASRPLIMLSSGGVVGAETAAVMPVRMIESGPAAGALGAAYAARTLGRDELISFDVGGTTAKICLLRNGRPLVTGQFEVDRKWRHKEGSGLPIAVPCIDMVEIGAGGGSIARVNNLGLLTVGPQSAGSRPGPACYALGGREATVTDANVVLGTIGADSFLGGTMRLDVAAAERAVGALAEQLGTTVNETARGIVRIMCETMAAAVKAHAAERGVDYRGVPLLAFGGAGPIHACEVANLLKSTTVVFPPYASVYSALGALVTPPRLDLVWSALVRIAEADWAMVARQFAEMEHHGRVALEAAGCSPEGISFRYAADLRYCGQHYDLLVDLPSRPGGPESAESIRRRFTEDYAKRYRITQDEVEIEIVNWRLVAFGASSEETMLRPRNGRKTKRSDKRRIHLWRDGEIVRVMPRQSLGVERVEGPVVLEEPDTTLVVPAGWSCRLGVGGAVIAERDS